MVTESLRMTDFDHASYIVEMIKAHQRQYGVPMPRRVLLSAIQADVECRIPRTNLPRTVMFLLGGLEDAGSVTVGLHGLSVTGYSSQV